MIGWVLIRPHPKCNISIKEGLTKDEKENIFGP